MAIDLSEFIFVCAACAEEFGVDGHYLMAVAQLRSGVDDGSSGDQIGPFRFTVAAWDALFAADTAGGAAPLDIHDWHAQCVVAALLMQSKSGELAGTLHRPPTPFELAEATWNITREDLARALEQTAGWLPQPQPEAGNNEVGPLPGRTPFELKGLFSNLRSTPGLPTFPDFGPAADRMGGVLENLESFPGSLRGDLRGVLKGFLGANIPEDLLPDTIILEESSGPVAAKAEEPDERRVDLALLRTDEQETAVTEHDALQPLGRYRVRVHIGERSRDSLLPEPPPPIAGLLSASETGHQLEVVIFGKDFAVNGANTRPLFLPVDGASEKIYFDVTAPQQPGAAQFRLGVYHDNHLVQSFVFSGTVAVAEPSEPVRARFLLEFSRTAHFKNLSELGPRGLSIGVNANGAATHGLFVKSVGATVEFPLPQRLLDEQVEKFRALLVEATTPDGAAPRFTTYPNAGDPISQDFHKYVARLADYGHTLYLALVQRPELLPALRDLAGSERQTIQVVRFDPNFVLPWAAIYDFNLPTPKAGQPVPQVCTGVVKAADGSLSPCGHKREDGVYCINGFWGVRHIVEELIGAGGGADAVHEIVRGETKGAVCLAVDVPEPPSDAMRQIFEKEMGDGFRPITASDVLLDLLWKDAERPALLIVLGHLETRTIADQPVGPRIVLPKGWLIANEILERVIDKTWEQPRTLVLLMGCQSGAMDLGTLTGFSTAFNSARAAGVAGTEVIAFSGLLTRFAQEVALALWRKETLGAAISDFRRRLLVAGNPLAFIFQALGGADIRLNVGN